jgi:hypothetical protein
MVVDVSSIDKAIKRWWKTVSLNLTQEIRSEILEQDLIYTGRMIGSIKVKTLVPRRVFQVVVDVPYASTLERGRRHVYADVRKLTEWAMRKKGESYEDAQRAAWAIATKLKKEGIRPRYFIRRAVRRFLRRFRARVGA